MRSKIFAVIPARGESKGIPRKNIKLIGGKPLVAYCITTALRSAYVDRVYVSTEDDKIATISKMFGAAIVKRPRNLAGDATPLDPVVHHALASIEKRKRTVFDLVLVLQPTSPLITPATINAAIETMLERDYDTLVSVVDATHMHWIQRDGRLAPIYAERKNRQFLDPLYKETGSFFVSRRSIVNDKTMIGQNVGVYTLSEEEGVDIDTYKDWWIAENLLKRLKIAFVVEGSEELGIGHVFRALTLANRMAFQHDLVFLVNSRASLGISKIRESRLDLQLYDDEDGLIERIEKIKPHIVINDILDTDVDYMATLKKNGCLTVNFEDMGEGIKNADLVINALYENSYPAANHFFGYRYFCLRDEFLFFPPTKARSKVKQVLVSFGGSDPNNLTLKTLRAIEQLDLRNTQITAILGLGYNEYAELGAYVEYLIDKGFKVVVKRNVEMMAQEISSADVAITSNGRTIYEVISLGVPCISMSQNERETRHSFAHNCEGVLYLGFGPLISEQELAVSLSKVITDYELRKKMNIGGLQYDLKKGTDRVLRLIIDRYYMFGSNAEPLVNRHDPKRTEGA